MVTYEYGSSNNVPAAVAMRRMRALSGVTGRKALCRGLNKELVESYGSTISSMR